MTPFLFHSAFVGFIQIGFNHPLRLLYFQVVPRFGRSLFRQINKSSHFALAAKTGNVRLAASPVMKASKGVAQRRSSEEVVGKSSYERSTSITSLSYVYF